MNTNISGDFQIYISVPLIQLKYYLSFNAKRVLISSYKIHHLVWIFSTTKSLNKIEGLHKRAFRIYTVITQCQGLLEKTGKKKMSVNRLRNLCIEIYKKIQYNT